MANENHLRQLLDAIRAQNLPKWNQWSEEHPDIRPDLSGADLKGTFLRGAHFSGTDLRRADLRGAFLSGANLWEAD